MKLRTLQRILSKLPAEPKNIKYDHIQSLYTDQNWPHEFAKSKDYIEELEAAGLYKSSAICRYYSTDVVDRAKLIDSGYRLKALDGDDMKSSLPELTKNQNIKYCSYVLGSLLLQAYPENGLEKLKFALDDVPQARYLYCQHLLKASRKVEVSILLNSIADLTTQDLFFLSLAESDRAKSLNCLVESAEGGLMEAQYNLGCLYLEGKLNGTKQQAQSWFYLSAFQGHQASLKNLQQFMASK